MLHLSDNIKLIRKLSGETQEEFARHFDGVSVAMQKSYEGGKAIPNYLYLKELSKIAGLPIDALQNQLITIEVLESIKKNKKVNGIEQENTVQTPDTTTMEEDYRNKYERLLEKTNAEQSAFITGMLGVLTKIDKNVQDVQANLNDAAEKQQIFRVMTNANQRVILENIALLRGLNKNELVNKARSIGDAHLHGTDEIYNSDASDNLNK